MKKILVTGASGFIGSTLVEQCLKHDDLEVYAGMRASSKKTYLQDSKIHFVTMDFADEKGLVELLRKYHFDYIIHNAGVTAVPNKAAYFRVNAGFTKNFADALKKANTIPEKFTLMSSLASYGPADNHGKEMVREEYGPKPITAYGESKLEAERYLEAIADFPYLIFRPTAVFGPKDKDLLTYFEMVKKGIETSVGFKPQKLTFIYVKDLARLIVNATLSPVKRKGYFVSDGNIYSTEELGSISRKFLNKKTLKIKVPTGIVRVLARFMEAAGKLNGSYPALNLEKVKELESTNWVCDVAPLIQDFNFQPTYNLATGIEETLKWYQKEKWL